MEKLPNCYCGGETLFDEDDDHMWYLCEKCYRASPLCSTQAQCDEVLAHWGDDQRLTHRCINQQKEVIGWMIHCPACKTGHLFRKGIWTFNENYEKPTFKASMLVYRSHNQPRCHSFVKDGSIQFLGDCEHDMANQTVDLKPF